LPNMAASRFWDQDDAHRDQKFYTAFCILTSMCSDYAIGLDLQAQKKLNWAATCIYYSLVHAGRLVCFLPLGDFPIAHRNLGELYADGDTSGNTWLKEHARLGFIDSQLGSIETGFSLKDIRSGLRKMRISPIIIQKAPQLLGIALPKACKLRNDANYEALLIAHEYNHQRVTRQFEQLVHVFSTIASRLLPSVIQIFKGFVDSSERNCHWYALLNWKSNTEGLYYIKESLDVRLNVMRGTWREINWHTQVYYRSHNIHDLLNPLRCVPDLSVDLAEAVHSNIIWSTFGTKSQVMDDFEVKIKELKDAIRRTSRKTSWHRVY